MTVTATTGPAGSAESSLDGRGRILREALLLFTTHGYAAVSMQQVANAANVNKATLYYHFEDKEGLFAAIIGEELRAHGESIAAQLAAGGTLREQLERVASHIIANHRKEFGRLMVDFREQVSDARRRSIQQTCPAPWNVLQELFTSARDGGEIREEIDPVFASRMFFAMVISQAGQSKFGDDEPAPASRPAEIAALLLHGIGRGREEETGAGPQT